MIKQKFILCAFQSKQVACVAISTRSSLWVELSFNSHCHIIAVHCSSLPPHQHQYNTNTNTATSTNTTPTPTLPPAPMVGSGLHWCKICTRLGHNLIHHSQLTRWQCTARQLLPSIDFTAPGAIQSPVNRGGAGGGGGGLWHKSQVAAKPVHKIRTWIILAATTTISPWDFI